MMTYHELIQKVSLETSSEPALVRNILDEAFQTIANHIINSDEHARVHIPMFGIFHSSIRSSRVVKNFQGKEMRLPAIKTIQFKPAKALKKQIMEVK